MKKLHKLFVLIIYCILIFIFYTYIGFAYENDSIIKQNEIPIPQNLYLEINDTCKGHKSFEQADANDFGNFIVLCSEINYDKENGNSIHRNFADIFDSNGNLICELSFKKCICAVRISNKTVYVIFKDNVLTYDLTTKETHFYETAELNLLANGGADIIQTQNFTVGNAQYKMSSNLFQDGYCKLMRYNNNQNQVILKYSLDYGNVFKQTATYSGTFILCIFLAVKYIRRKRIGEKR